MTYFLYARKSTDVEDKQVLSIEGQLQELRSLARSEGLEISTEFTESRTAKVPGRPIFNDMMNRIQRGEAQGVICWKLDRLARNPVDDGLVRWLLQLEGRQTRINDHRGGILARTAASRPQGTPTPAQAQLPLYGHHPHS